MRITLDREKKLFLLQALRDGHFEAEQFNIVFNTGNPSFMTDEQIQAEIERLQQIGD